jgi:hypothetical protein
VSPAPAVVTRWGDARDALAAVHNLETLVKSARVARERVVEVLPEMFASCAALRAAFDAGASPGRAELRAFAMASLARLEDALRAAGASELDPRARIELEKAVVRAGADLDAATELLEVLERAEHHRPTEHSVHELARVAIALAAAIRPRGSVLVKLDVSGPDATVVSDAHVLARLLVHAVTWVSYCGARVLTLRPRVQADRVTFVVAPATPDDDALPARPTVTLRRVVPTDAVVLEAVRAIGAVVEVDVARGSLTLPRAAEVSSAPHE